MALQEGFVSKILTRPYNGKTMYSVALQNQDGFFGFGLYKPHADVGDKVQFEAIRNEKGYWQATGGSLKIVAKGSEQNTVHTNGAVPPITMGKSPQEKGYWDRREAREVRNDELRELGATRNTAIEWIKVLLTQEALKLPAKQADKEAALQALLTDTVDKLRGKTSANNVVTNPVPKASVAKVDVPEDKEESWN